MTLIQEARRVYRRTRRNPDCSFLELVARLRYEQSRKYRQKVVRIKHAIHHSMPTIRRRLDAWAAGDFTGGSAVRSTFHKRIWPPPEPEFTCVMEPAPPRTVLRSQTWRLYEVEGWSEDKDGNEIPGSRWDTGLRLWKLE